MNEMQVIRVRYWAAARSAAGVSGESVETTDPLSLAALRAELVRRHPGSSLHDVLSLCSVLVGERPVSSRDPDGVTVRPGETVEFLPPFAGG